MIHSFSNFKIFRHCQRKWFYESKVWCTNTKDPFRQKVIMLSNLETINAFRGQVVDYTISKHVVESLNKRKSADLKEALAFAKDIFDKRRKFAEAKMYKDFSIKKTANEERYAALIELEFGGGLSESDWEKAWCDVETSLTNLIENHEVMSVLKSANFIKSQLTLNFKHDDTSVRCVPDLVAFFRKEPPLIIDWKVHFAGHRSYIDQLLLYAYALKECKHLDTFNQYLVSHDILNFRLLEYQLLKNVPRHYEISPLLLENTKVRLSDEIFKLKKAGADQDYDSLKIENFDTTFNEEDCLNCPFQKLCSNDN
ncbi:MAG: PD-(D/E)XK nuclease family protein [Bacteroidetes bacterium]|nr:PD-(D/E)XK nuclease family protein [Bacteroidota bacterium]